MNKLKAFMKQYGIYLAVSVVSLAVILALFLIPLREGVIQEEKGQNLQVNLGQEVGQANPNDSLHKQNNQVIELEGEIAETEKDIPGLSETLEGQGQEDSSVSSKEKDYIKEENKPSIAEEEVVVNNSPSPSTQNETANSEEVAHSEKNTTEEEISTETFETTTVDESQLPFFAEGDTFLWPVKGEIIVPYTDEHTTHWKSPALKQTMRTFGICIASEKGQAVGAAAEGIVVDVIKEPSKMPDTLKYVGDLGSVLVLDHGNGYKSYYGFQKGEANESLVGKVVGVGETIGTIGEGKGPFTGQGSNIYFQITRDDVAKDPLELLEHLETNEIVQSNE